MNKITVILLLVVVAMIAYAAYYLGSKNAMNTQVQVTPVVTSTPGPLTQTPALSPTTTATPKAESSSDETVSLIAAVQKGLVAKHGPDAATLNVTVTTISGNYAKGMASATAGGGIWFAAKTNGSWLLVWDGNGIITCSDVAPYPNFPASLIPECFNSVTQKMVTR